MDAESSVATQLCARGSIVVCSIDPPFEESASPFIDEGDDLTSERESMYATKACCPRRRVQDGCRRP